MPDIGSAVETNKSLTDQQVSVEGLKVNPFAGNLALDPTQLPDANKRYKLADAGSSVLCAIRSKDAGMDCFGMNDVGQLNAPKGRFKTLSAGENHVCAINQSGVNKCWGDVDFPESLKSQRFLQTSAGDNHDCGLTKNRSIVCWGDDSDGKLNAPKGMFKSVSVRANHACAVSIKNDLACWGDSTFMALALPSGKFQDVSVGRSHACATTAGKGELVCWGKPGMVNSSPKELRGIKQLVSGNDHTCALLRNKSTVCWGENGRKQLNLPDQAYKSVSAGGRLTCGLTVKGYLQCAGSFAYNDIMHRAPIAYDADIKTASDYASPMEGGAKDVFTAAGKGIVGAALSSWAENLLRDKEPGGEAVLMLASILGSGGQIKIKLALEEINSKLDAMTQTLDNIVQRTDELKRDIAVVKCDVNLNNFDATLNELYPIKQKYLNIQKILKADMKNMTAARVNSAYSELLPYENKVKDLISQIPMALIGNGALKPLNACLEKGLLQWQGQATHPFDDRKIYQGVYELIQLAHLNTAYALFIADDMSSYKILNILTESGKYKEPPVNGLNAANLCNQVESLSNQDAQNQRLSDASLQCKLGTKRAKDTYNLLVKSIEEAGAPYSDEGVVLSLSSDLFRPSPSSNPYGAAKSSWLWLRNIDGQPDSLVMGNWTNWRMSQSAGAFLDAGSVNTYFTGGDVDKSGTWRSDGRAWNDVFISYEGYRKEKKITDRDDFINLMALSEDVYAGNGIASNKIFNGISNKPFWMSWWTFNMDWRSMLRISDWKENDKHVTNGMKCFVASNITLNPRHGYYWANTSAGNDGRYYNHGYRVAGYQDVPLGGKVCSSPELARISVYYTNTAYNTIKINDLQCGQWESRALACFGNGWSRFATDPDSPDNYKPYQKYLGTFLVEWEEDNFGRSWSWDWLDQTGKDMSQANFYPNKDAKLFRMPVVDIAARVCKTRIDTSIERNPARIVGPTAIPSRCGSDMDEFIERMLSKAPI